MTTSSDMNFCRLTCWGLGLLAGLLIAAVLALLINISSLISLLIGIVCFLVIGYLLARFVCVGGADASVGTLGAAGAVGAAGAAGVAAAAGSSASAAQATASGAADAVSETASSTSGAASGAASAAAGAAAEATLSPSAKLAGQEELASRKGSWKYEGGDAGADDGSDAGAAKAKADADAAAAAAKAKADADASAAAAKAKADADASAAAAKAKADADASAAAAKAKADADAASAAAKAKADAAAAAKAKADADAAAQKAKADAAAKKASSAGAAAPGAGTKPAALTSARGGKADDLKRINGVGPKLEGTLNGMGVYHFDQIAGWSDKELEWVDGNLEGFYGRASRDEWIPQAKVLAGQGSDTGNRDYDGDGIIEGTNEGTKPATLTAARGGKADNLKEIKGIGPKMEKLCNKLGFYHFDQIAAWTSDEVAWVDANLEGFRGRVTRDTWVAQAKVLAAGGETEFSKRVEDGGVY